MSSFVLKIIAIISMVFDHASYIIYGKFSWMNYIGRLAFPIFAFQLTEGYNHTKSLKKYLLRLTIFAFISQIPYMIFLNTFHASFNLNILFTLILGLLTIYFYAKCKHPVLGLLIVILSCIIAEFCYFDYGWFGITIIFIFYIFKNKKILMSLYFLLAVFIYYFYKYITTFRIEYWLIMLFTALSLIPICLYNGKKGKNVQYLLYIFYPLHFVILYFLHFVI